MAKQRENQLVWRYKLARKNESGILNKKRSEDPPLKDFFNPNGLFASRKTKKQSIYSQSVYKRKTGRMDKLHFTLNKSINNKILYALKEALQQKRIKANSLDL